MKGQLNIIGDAVRKYRRAKKWTQHDLAGRRGIVDSSPPDGI